MPRHLPSSSPAADDPAVVPVWPAPLRRMTATLPGLVLSALIAAAAFALHDLPGMTLFSPLFLAAILGLAFRTFFGLPSGARPGTGLCMSRLLRLGIILMGLQLTLGQLAAVGTTSLLVVVITMASTFALTFWLGRRLGVSHALTGLLAAGTSICGASAIVATHATTNASDEDVAYAVACVTAFGTLSMLAYPFLAGPLGLDSHQFGLWAGASIHEVAQVVATAFQFGPDAGTIGTITKLARVILLVPVVIGLGWHGYRRQRQMDKTTTTRPPLPWFVAGFVALIGINSVLPIPDPIHVISAHGTTFLLTMALAAMGLQTHPVHIIARGARPLLLGAIAWLFIAVVSLGLIIVLT